MSSDQRRAFRSLEDLRRDAARRAADMAKPEADKGKELADSPLFARIKQDLCDLCAHCGTICTRCIPSWDVALETLYSAAMCP